MPQFRYRAADPSGQVQDILVQGDHADDAARQVRRRGLVPIRLVDTAGRDLARPALPLLRGRVDAAAFTDRLAPLLHAGIPLDRAMQIIGETAESPAEARLVAELLHGLRGGARFSQLLREHAHGFPRLYASVVEAGEESGALPAVLAQLRDYLILMRDLRAYVISASIYPAFVVCFSLGVVAILLGGVVPRLASVMTGAAAPPHSVVFLLNASAALRHYWWAGIFALVLLVLLARWALARSDVRHHLDIALVRLPGIRRIVLLAELGRQTRTMALLIRNGVHLLDAVRISTAVLANSALRESIASLSADLRRGDRLSDALARSPYMPPLITRMLAVSEETGDTDRMLDVIADRYEADLRHAVKRLLAWFEPVTILALGGGVGAIVYLMFMAILSMWNQI